MNCTRCKCGFVDILVNWTEPKTFSPIKKYRIQFGPEYKVFGKTFGVGRYDPPLNRPPVSSPQSIANKLLITLMERILEFYLYASKRYLFWDEIAQVLI